MMKAFLRLICASALAQLFAGGVIMADPVKASIAAIRGEVSVNGAKMGPPLPAPMKTGGIVKAGPDSGAILIPVPGQTVFVDHDTELEVKKCEMTAGPDSSWARRSVCVLKQGHVHSSIAHPKAGVSHHELITPRATLSADGTSWSTWSDAKGTHAAVYAGVVTITFGGIKVDLQPGQVATLTGEGDAAVLEVLDLKTGIIVRYTKGSPQGLTELASVTQIQAARELFWQGLGAFSGTASEADRLAFSQIVERINTLLVFNHLPPFNGPFEWVLWPNWFRLDPSLQNLASPDQPLEQTSR